MDYWSVFGIKILFATLAIFTSSAFASPAQLTYQGRILKSDGAPLEYSNVSFVFQVMDPSGQCLIYQEQVNAINMVNSGGVFDVPIGVGTVQFPLASPSTILDAFNNSAVFTCGTCSATGGTYSCANGTSNYTAASGDSRKLRVSFHDGNGWKTISPDSTVRSVPFAGYALSAEKLGTNVANDFVLKAGLPTCAAGTFLSWDGTALSCAAVAGSNGGTVTNVTSQNSYLTITNNTSTPALTLNVGTTANTVAAGNDPRIINAIQSGSSASGDLGGSFPGVTVVALQGVGVSSTAPTSGQFLKFNGTQWGAAAIGISDVSGLSAALGSALTQSAFNGYVASAGCSSSQTMYWNSVAGNFQCQAINVSLAGDLTGSIGAAKVVALQNRPVDTTAPTANQVLQWDGAKWAPSTLPTGNYVTALTGDVTASGPGSAAATVAKLQGSTLTITTPASGNYLRYNGSAFVNATLAASDVTGTLSASNIPNLDWSKIASGTPTTLAGYGITDSLVNNAGGTPSIQSGTDATKPGSPSAGAIYFATDTNKIYQFNSGSWALIASAGGSGGTITALTSDVSASGSGSVTATVNSVGGSTAANVHSAELAANAATASNTNSTIVKRDASGNFSAGNVTFVSGKGSIYTDSGTNTVTLSAPTTIATSYALKWPTGQGGSNQVLTNDGSGNLSWTTPSAGGTVASVAVTAPITDSGTATAPNIGIQQASGSQPGYLSSADWTTFNGKMSSSLASANIWVGNGSSVATAVAPNGDVTLNNTGKFTVTQIQGTAVSATAPTTSGQVLRYSGSAWAASSISMFDLRSTLTGAQAFGGVGCTAGQTITWTAATDNLSCTNISVSSSQVSFGSQSANTFFAAPSGSAGTPSFRTIASADLPAGTLTGSGTSGYVPYYSAASTLTSSPIYTDGTKVGVGTSTPGAKLQVNGAVVSAAFTANAANSSSALSLDYSQGNVAVVSTTGGNGNVILSNMVVGGSYTVIIQDGTSLTYDFTNGGSGSQCASGTTRYLPTNAATTAGKHTVYAIVYAGTGLCYITWASGF